MEQLTIPPEIAAALVDAQLAAKPVAKDGWNKDKGYAFATSEAILDEGRQALANSGLAAFATEPAFVEEWSTSPEEGSKPQLISWCEMSLNLVHRSGQGLTFKIRHPVFFTIPNSNAAQPFGVARTRALGLFVRDLLLLPALGEDAEGEGGEESKKQSERKPRGEVIEARKIQEEARRQMERTAARTGKAASGNANQEEQRDDQQPSELMRCWVALVKVCGGNLGFARGWWEQHQLPDPKTAPRPIPAEAIQKARALVDKVTHNQLTKDPNAVIDTRGT